MKKTMKVLLVLFFLFYAYQIIFIFFSKGHSINYDLIDDKYSLNVIEIYNAKTKDNDSNYYISINAYGDKFNYLINDDFNKQSKIIKNVKYHIDEEYSCLFVKYTNNSIQSDVICKKGKIYYPFSNLSNPSLKLLDYIASLEEQGYYIRDYKDNFDESYTLNSIQITKSNFNENHFIGLNTNDTLYRITINQRNEQINLPKNKIQMSTYVNNYFINFIYDDEFLTAFDIYDINDGKYKEIKTNISKISSFLGKVKDNIYIYDPENHKEYEINAKDTSIIEIGNSDTGIKYFKNGEWVRTSYDDFEVNKIQFDKENNSTYIDSYYNSIKQVGNNYGYYYFLKQVNNEYEVYRSSLQDPDNKMYLFNTSDINSIRFIQNDVYYRHNNYIKYYSDKTSNRIILTSKELSDLNFNYNVFIKKKKM